MTSNLFIKCVQARAIALSRAVRASIAVSVFAFAFAQGDAQAGWCAGTPNADNGAKAICTKPEAKGDWKFEMSDCGVAFVPRSYAMCMAMGGEWDPNYINGPICINFPTLTENRLAGVASDFIQRYHDPCVVNGTDSGWTGSVNAGGTCGIARSLIIDGIIRSQVRLFSYTGTKSPRRAQASSRRRFSRACPRLSPARPARCKAPTRTWARSA